MRRRRWPWVLVAAVVAVLLGLEGLAESQGHSLDPTDPMNYDYFALRNDAATPLYVHLCAEATCTRLDGHFGWVVVQPVSSDTERVYWGRDFGAVYAVATAPALGAGLRCLTVSASKKTTSPTVALLSTAAACPR
jgi:hypothetical protein